MEVQICSNDAVRTSNMVIFNYDFCQCVVHFVSTSSPGSLGVESGLKLGVDL